MSEAEALGSLLAAEHAAVYGYGVLGARLDDQTRTVARAAFDRHRTQRNALQVLMQSRGLATPGPSPSYDVAVADRLEALRLAIRIETGLAVRWRDLIGVTLDAALRRPALDALTACAVSGTRWRQLASVLPLTEPFPGQA